MLEEVARYSLLWWMAVVLVVVGIPAYTAGLGVGFECAILMALVYGLVWLTRYFENYPREVTIPWYVAVLGLGLALPVLLALLCGLFWLLRRFGYPWEE